MANFRVKLQGVAGTLRVASDFKHLLQDSH